MHLDPEAAVFDGRGRLPLPLWSRCGLMLGGLAAVIIIDNLFIIAGISAVALGLMVVEKAARIRIILPLIFLLNILLLLALWKYWGLDVGAIAAPLLRSFSSTCVLSWFGATVSWNYLKHKYFNEPPLAEAAEFIDFGILHGQLLIMQISKRFEAARVRIGNRYKHPRNVGLALAGGVATSFDRAIHLNEAFLIRRSDFTSFDSSLSQGSNLEAGDSGKTPVLSVSGLSVKTKEDVCLLREISFSLQAGEWLLISGPSGSGKTTLLRAISGLQKGSAGQIIFNDGQDLQKRKNNTKIGIVFQNPDDQFFATTPREDVIWGLKNIGIHSEEACRLAEKFLDQLGVGRLADHPISRLSFGEKRRVAMAGILAVKPSIILCDEPTSGLDSLASERLISTLEEVTAEHGTSVIWVSHDIHIIPRHVEKALLLKEGHQICFEGLPSAINESMLQAAGLKMPREKL